MKSWNHESILEFWRKIDGSWAERALHMSSLPVRYQQTCDGPATEALNVYQVKEVEGRMQRDRQVLTHQRRCLRSALNKLAWILALVLSVVWCAHAQQTDDVQKQIQQLKEQYERTTRELQARIDALEQQQKKASESKEAAPAKEGVVSAVELAAQDAAKTALGQSKEKEALQGQVPAAPTYDQMRDAETEIKKLG